MRKTKKMPEIKCKRKCVKCGKTFYCDGSCDDLENMNCRCGKCLGVTKKEANETDEKLVCDLAFRPKKVKVILI
jgi:hypothetical protein